MINRRSLLECLLALGLAGPTVLVTRDAFAGDPVLIRNAKNGTAKISREDAKKLFTGQSKTWPGGAVVQAVLYDKGAELGWLASRVFGISPRELLSKIKQEVFRGEMKRPVMVDSSADCAAAVAKSDGAIGVVDAATAAALPAGVAVLTLSD